MKGRTFGILWRTLLVVLVLGVGLAGGVIFERHVLAVYASPAEVPADATDAFDLMAEAWKTIEEQYVAMDMITPQQLAYGAVRGMVDALGDTGHSRFLTPEELQAHDRGLSGSFEGIGAYVEERDGNTVIVAPIDGSPAQAAGLRPGDVILAVDGEDVTGLPLDEVIERILGPAGTQVTLSVAHPDEGQVRVVEITRARVDLEHVTWEQIPGTDLALIRIVSFSDGVSADLREALNEIQAQELSGVVLDLRNNPGGLLSEAIGVGSQFLEGGKTIVKRESADGNIRTEVARPGGVALDIPLVVLINEGSASASEIVSGAVQENDRAVLVGETTFGTGTVLNQFGLSDGSAILLATEQWLTPDGRVIWHEGVAPDVEVALDLETFPLSPQELRDMTPEGLQERGDVQLQRAIELLGEG